MFGFFKNLSISFKLVLVASLLAAIFLGSLCIYVVINIRDDLLTSAIIVFKSEIEKTSERLNTALEEIPRTVRALSATPPIQGMVRASKNEGIDDTEQSTMDQWRSRLADIFSAQMEASGFYDQLRYIDETGQEIVRVDYTGSGTIVVAEDELQYKGDREYFITANALQLGEIYVSRTELNREGTPPEISFPYRPTMRFAVPVFDEVTGERKGIVIANTNFYDIIGNQDINQYTVGVIYIVDHDRYFLEHPDSSKEWGSARDLGTGYNLFSEFSGVIGPEDMIEESGSFLKAGQLFVFSHVHPDQSRADREWVIINTIPENTIFSEVNKLVVEILLLSFLVFAVLIGAYALLIKRMLLPLQLLVDGSEEIGKGNFATEVKVVSSDEIGRVAVAFNQMVERLRKLYASLEDKVKQRTKELNSKVDELEEAKEKIEIILESIADGVFVIDKNFNIILYNKVCEDLSGFKKEEAMGKSYQDIFRLVHEEENEVNDAFVKDALETGEVQDMANHTELIRKDGGRIPVSDSASPIKDASGKTHGVVVVCRDVSKEREVDKAKTEFVSLASHQLRTPLTAIRWNAELLLSGDAGKLNKEQKAFVNEIYQGNQRMVGLVDALLNVSRLELGTFKVEPQMVSLVEIAESLVKELKPSMTKKKLVFKENYGRGALKLKTDAKLVRIVLQNLLSNAVKYTPNAGTVELEIKKQTNNILIRVSDTGYGIPEEQQSKMFSKLFRADNVLEKKTEGTGLGMYIVDSIVKEMGGKIWFESVENEGTTFYVSLPLTGVKKKEGIELR